MGTKVFFFKGDKFASYDRGEDMFDPGFPVPIRGNWPGLWDRNIDSAINWGNGKVYFFKGSEYMRFDVVSNKVDVGATSIRKEWPGMHETGFAHNIDAAINWGNGKAYFFKGRDYVRYFTPKATEGVDLHQGRIPISKEWDKRQHFLWNRDIGAAINWGNGKVYFFKGSEYMRYDMATDNVDVGATPISREWLGIDDPGFLSNFDAVVDVFDETKELLVPGAQLRLAPAHRRVPFTPSPWRGVLHTTEDNHNDPRDCTSPSLSSSLLIIRGG